MKRSSTALRQWLQLRRALYYTKPATPSSRANDFLAVSSATLFTLPTSHNNPSHTRRPFHSTQSQHAQRRKARPAPAVARKRETVESYQISGVPGWVNKEGIWLTSLNLSVETEFKDWIRKHMEMAEHHYDRAINDGYLSSAISLATFRDVFAKLCREAWFTRPSGQSIRAISVGM